MTEQGRPIEFIERVDILGQLSEALDMSRTVMELGVGGDLGAMAESAQYLFPKLRFIWLSLQRYIFASRFLRDDDLVIDVPCGPGFGAAILASNGNKVLGLDIDEESIDLAKDTYRFPNMEFEVGDMLTYDYGEVDFITCLDGLEHITPGKDLIERFVGALSDNGILVVAVPINELLITGGERNPFHMEDYDYDKLVELLTPYFSKVSVYGHDLSGAISDASFAFDGLTAICEV